jgi:hypothetical protein
MSGIPPIVWDILTPIITGIVVAIISGRFNKHIQDLDDKREQEREIREKVKEKEVYSRISLLFATAKLSYATAIAVRDGKTNGEMQDALKSYDEAKDKYNSFINEVHSKVVSKD